MSVQPILEPCCGKCPDTPSVETIIEGRARDLGGFSVRRVLPARARRMIGPFIFFDEMGPASIPKGQGLDVRPHPHVNLATVTYLFDGEIVHRDSLGSHQPITPGAINWMTAGRGIVHSERTSPEQRSIGPSLHGIQLWVALPKEHEETEPAFRHHPAASLPETNVDGVRIRVLAGSAYGLDSPVEVLSPLMYVESTIPPGGTLALPDDHHDRAAYVVEGVVTCGAETVEAPRMMVFRPDSPAAVHSATGATVMLIGGEPLGERHIFWNFVSSDKTRIEKAKEDWKAGRFPKVPGDEDEFIPLPE